MKLPPTDHAILKDIYENYYETFVGFSKGAPARSAKIHVPIDVKAIAKRLGVDGDIVFGRLHYHLEQKHGYTRPMDDGEGESRVPFFSLGVGDDRHCVNFPLLASVLADLEDQRSQYFWGVKLAAFSLVVSIAHALISIIFR